MRAKSLSCDYRFLPIKFLPQKTGKNSAAMAIKYVTKSTAAYPEKVFLLPQLKMFLFDPIKAKKPSKVK
jgi:hypothetical protein